MLSVEQRAEIRRAYYVEKKSMRQIARETGHARETVKKAIKRAGPVSYRLKEARPAPVLGPYKGRIEELLAENERLPHKQRYTAQRIFEIIVEEGYEGSASGVRRYVGERRRERRKKQVYLKLEFDPGQDAQVDWGEGQVILKGELTTAQLFVMRLGYSRRTFVKAYPTQRQECFFAAIIYSTAATARRVRAMRKAAWNTWWAMPAASSWCRCPGWKATRN
jgi:transposase